ncbi:hypothetical protein NIES4071_105450 (plasmid) [Calothrix sp. NIES-4071]|nr:hypothetical protein NIES4071_105450 [Calothrix sp. NIES-4071]BAZ64963.1 hypothetical protein NIES4105_106960 [Calothrix sp. NIES-4105]
MRNKRLWILVLFFISVLHVIILTKNTLDTGGGAGELGGAGGLSSPSPIPTAKPTDAGAATTSPARTQAAPDGADEALKKVIETRPGQIAFNVPGKMKVNDAEVVEVVISDDLQRDLKKELGNQTGTEIAKLQVSSFLKA